MARFLECDERLGYVKQLLVEGQGYQLARCFRRIGDVFGSLVGFDSGHVPQGEAVADVPHFSVVKAALDYKIQAVGLVWRNPLCAFRHQKVK